MFSTAIERRLDSPTFVGSLRATIPVLHVGPSPELIGGMASVMRQVSRLRFEGRFRTQLAPQTASPGGTERWWSRVGRHIQKLGELRAAIGNAREELKSSRVGPRGGGVRPIVHLHTCSGFSFHRTGLDLCVARAMGCRVVLHIHGAAFDSFWGRASFAGKMVIRWALRRADAVVALSRTWANKLQDMSPEARVEVIENAIDPPVHLPDRRGRHPVHFLFLAKMDVWKGVHDLLRACAILKDQGVAFRLTLAGPSGTAGDPEALETLICTQGLRPMVEYIGSVVGDAKNELLERCDALVLPSHHEGMPLVLLEAMAHGLPVVASTVGSVPDVVTCGREGLLVPPRHPERLAEAMSQITQDEARRLRMGHAGRRLVERRFSMARFERDLLRIYDEIGEAGKFVAEFRATFDHQAVHAVSVARTADALRSHLERPSAQPSPGGRTRISDCH